jgi:PA14 domain-containing protein
MAGDSSSACAIDGYFEATQPGYYTFFLESDGSATLVLGNQPVMTVDGSSDTTRSGSFILPLQPGLHAIRIEYRHSKGDKALDLTYLPPSSRRDSLAHLPIAIPSEREYAP